MLVQVVVASRLNVHSFYSRLLEKPRILLFHAIECCNADGHFSERCQLHCEDTFATDPPGPPGPRSLSIWFPSKVG